MRVFALIPVLTLVAAGAGLALCAAAGWDAHVEAMVAAAGVSVLAGAAAGAVLIVARRASQSGVAQAALVGLSVQMLLSLALCGVTYLASVPLDTPFALWLLTFYWVNLSLLAVAFVRLMKVAPADEPKSAASPH